MAKRAKQSAGLLLFRHRQGALEVFLVHPGGPFWVHQDEGAWTIPKGEFEDDEEPLVAARREFTEETGVAAEGPFIELGSVRQKSGKLVLAWACEGDCDPAALVSNTCEIEWPPRSKQRLVIAEVDRGGWFGHVEALRLLRAEQHPLLARLAEQLSCQA